MDASPAEKRREKGDVQFFASFPTSSLGTEHSGAPLRHFLNEKNAAFPNRVWEREKQAVVYFP